MKYEEKKILKIGKSMEYKKKFDVWKVWTIKQWNIKHETKSMKKIWKS